MAVTIQALAVLVGSSPSHPGLQSSLDEGQAMVDEYVQANSMPDKEIPGPIMDRAILEVAADMFYRRSAPFGIVNQGYSGAEGMVAEPARISRDPLTVLRPLLAQWCFPVGLA